MGFRVSVSLHPAIQATGRLTFAPAGLIPAEHTSLRWTHKRSQSPRLHKPSPIYAFDPLYPFGYLKP
jgi:hypothetical protein